MNQTPCLGCSERHVGCHSSCERYQQFRSEMDRRLQERRHQNDADNAIVNGFNRRKAASARMRKLKIRG